MKNILKQWANEAKRKNKKKHQLGWWVKLNAGDNEKNVEFFNHVSGADGGDTGVFSGVGDGGGGMGESIETAESEKQKNEHFLSFDEIEESKMNKDDIFHLEYDDLDVTYYDSDGNEYETYIEYDYKTDNASIEEILADFLLNDYPNLDDESGEKVFKYLDKHYDEVVDKYYDKLLDKYRDDARKEAEYGGYDFDRLHYDYDDYDEYDKMLDDKIWNETTDRLENESLCEVLNRIDCDTCGEFGLVNMYEACGLSEEEEKFLSDRLAEGATPSELYEYLEEKLMSDGLIDKWYSRELAKRRDKLRSQYADMKKRQEATDAIKRAMGSDDLSILGKYGESDTAKQMRLAYEDELRRQGYMETLGEDTVKRNGKWVNVGKDGKADSGKFRTKKEADAQRKAMYAQGYKGESLNNYETTDISSLDDVFNSLDLYGKRGRITENTEIDFDADDDTSYFNEEE